MTFSLVRLLLVAAISLSPLFSFVSGILSSNTYNLRKSSYILSRLWGGTHNNVFAEPSLPDNAATKQNSYCRGGSRTRRDTLFGALTSSWSLLLPQKAAAAASKDIAVMLEEVDNALTQLLAVPTMIKTEKWDAVRNVLVTPPISNFRKANIWQAYADAVEAKGGDEFEVLELKEELQSHLQGLDMAVYNNIFNPITTQGETGATKELVRSYYEDPIREYEASKVALESLIRIATSAT